MSIINAKDLTKEFGSKDLSVQVIKGINLEIQKGEYVAITGASGSGKSTLLYLLAGLESPTKGKVYIDGRDLSSLKEKEISWLRRNEISFVYQYYNLIPNLTIYENIVLPKRVDKKLSKEDKEFLNELIIKAGIKEIINRKPDEVSGGEQQRAAFLRAVFIKPKIIFADEPTGNLDSKSSLAVMNLIEKINSDYGATIIMVTHSLEQAKRAQRIINLQDGKII